MNWFKALNDGNVAAFACARSSLASKAAIFADWIWAPYFRARVSASWRSILRRGAACSPNSAGSQRTRRTRSFFMLPGNSITARVSEKLLKRWRVRFSMLLRSLVRILVIEDDRRMAALIEQGLSEEGHSVFVARDGQQGLEVAQACSLDVIVLDLSLPKLDGL